MKFLHVVPGLEKAGNGIAVAARLVADRQAAELVDAGVFSKGRVAFADCDEVWVHGCWLPAVWLSCWRVLREGKRLVRMPHGNYDPVRLKYHGWKKRLAGPIERFLSRRASRIVATCDMEKAWVCAYLDERLCPVAVMDLKDFFDLGGPGRQDPRPGEALHLLYLGRRHPLKGLKYLEAAVAGREDVALRLVGNAFGEEKEKVWDWCDVLVLPTLSENFGLVVAEALARGKRAITTDGAPAWGEGGDYGGRLIYLKGYRDGSPETKVALLKAAVSSLAARPTKNAGEVS